MAESGDRPEGRPAPEARRRPAGIDRELDLRGIWGFAALVAATTVLLHLVVWGILVGERRSAALRDPPRSPLAEANERRLPPLPRLQDRPAREMEALRAEEDARLSTYGWIDRPAGVGRIPIDRAMDLILERGLPEPAGPSSGPEQAPAPPRHGRRPRGTS